MLSSLYSYKGFASEWNALLLCLSLTLIPLFAQQETSFDKTQEEVHLEDGIDLQSTQTKRRWMTFLSVFSVSLNVSISFIDREDQDGLPVCYCVSRFTANSFLQTRNGRILKRESWCNRSRDWTTRLKYFTHETDEKTGEICCWITQTRKQRWLPRFVKEFFSLFIPFPRTHRSEKDNLLHWSLSWSSVLCVVWVLSGCSLYLLCPLFQWNGSERFLWSLET